MRKVYTVEMADALSEGHPFMVFERVEDAEEFEQMARVPVIVREILFVEDTRLAKEAREYVNAQAAND